MRMTLSTLVGCLIFSVLALACATENALKDKVWCFEWREKYGIEPGQSFGQLPAHLHNVYLAAKCYRFFCKPHPMAGNGKFKCEPLDQEVK